MVIKENKPKKVKKPRIQIRVKNKKGNANEEPNFDINNTLP